MADDDPTITKSVKPARKFRITVEPLIFLYAFGMFLHGPVIQQYVYKAVSDMKGFQNNQIEKTGCGDDSKNNSSIFPNTTVDNDELRRQVQSLSSIISLMITLGSNIPGLFIALFMGAMTDRIGRRPAVILPPLGSAIEAGIVLLVMNFNLPVYILFAGALISGMCGSFAVIMIGVLSYISDVTEEKDRPLRLAVLEAMVFLGGCISYSCSGIWIKAYGFIPPYWMVFSCTLAAALYGMFYLKESRPKTVSTPGESKPNCLHNLKQAFSVFTQPRKEGVGYLVALVISESIVTVCTMGISAVLVLLALDTPFCMSSTLVGYFMAFRLFTLSIGAIIGLKFLPRCLMQPSILILSFVSMVLAAFVMGLAKTIGMLFLSPLVGALQGAAGPILKGLMSKTVSSDQQGALFTAVVTIENACNIVASICFNSLYSWSQTTLHFHGFVFMISGVLMIIPLVLLIYVRCTVKTFTSKELVQAPLVDNDVLSDEESSNTNSSIISRAGAKYEQIE